VAEGVEHEAQFTRLQAMGCDQVQGFMFAPPLKEDRLLELIRQPLAY
jgi:EAL domain-containing protein (putative c-di-GMP-specific phosphodiesterase class I)